MPTLWIIAYCLLWVVVLAEGILLFSVIKALNKFVEKIQKVSSIEFSKHVEKGAMAPPFKLKDQFNNALRIGPNIEQNTILLFISHSCPSCKRIIQSISPSFNIQNTTLAFISNGHIEQEYIQKLTSSNISYIADEQLFQMYNVTNAPQAIVINKYGIVIDTFTVGNLNDLNKTEYTQHEAV